MASTSDLTRLKDKIDAQRKEKDKAIGALEQIESKLKETFDCDDIAQARIKLKKLTKEAELKTAKADAALQDFNDKHGDKL